MDLTSPALHFFDTHRDADEAIRTLHVGGFDVSKLSLVSNGFHSEEHPVGFYTLGDRVRSWGREGSVHGSVSDVADANAILAKPRPVSVT